jgi:hypothetical protein
MGTKRDQPPTWSGAMGRAAFGAAIFFVAVVLLFKQGVGQSLGFAALVFLLYIPMGHALDVFLYRRRVRARQREHEERKARS